MEGGIQAWKGFVAKGLPDSGMTYFSAAHRPEELMALAWLLEEGTRKFYAEIAKMLAAQEAVNLFRELMADEKAHQESLFQIYRGVSGPGFDPGFPGSIVAIESGETYMEGGMRLNEALAWAKGEDLKAILELSISQEVNSSDLYIKMERKVEDQIAKKVFNTLSREEEKHLARLDSFLEERLRGVGE